MRIAETIECLRRRFQAIRGGRSLLELAGPIGVTHITLAQFLAGAVSTRAVVLGKIERWVEEQEAQDPHA